MHSAGVLAAVQQTVMDGLVVVVVVRLVLTARGQKAAMALTGQMMELGVEEVQTTGVQV